MVEFLTTFFNLLSCDLVDNDRFYQNFSKAVSAVSFNEKISKDTQILDEDVSPVKRNLRLFADGLEIEGFCNRIRFSRLWRYGLLHNAYMVNAIPVLEFHRDFSGDLYFEDSEYGFGKNFFSKIQKIRLSKLKVRILSSVHQIQALYCLDGRWVEKNCTAAIFI